MIIQAPSSYSFQLFNINIRFYSICILIAIILSVLLSMYFSKKFKNGTDREILSDFIPSLLIFGIIGARLYYVLLSLNYFLVHPLEIFMVWRGGLSIHGAILFGVLFGIYYFRKKKLNFFKYSDIIALCLPLGQAVGRFGNYFNQEAFGMPCDNSIFKLYVDEQYRPQNYIDFSYFHPVFLYESILNILSFIILYQIMKKTANKYDGLVFFSYILLYSIIRAILEPIRIDTVLYIFNIPFPFIVSIVLILLSIIGIKKRIS